MLCGPSGLGALTSGLGPLILVGAATGLATTVEDKLKAKAVIRAEK